jgi:hypothetical protein
MPPPAPVALAALALVAAGCVAPAAPPAFHVGPVSDSDAVVAVVREGTRVTAYVCGGERTYDTLTRWFEADVREGDAVTITRDGYTLRLESSAPDAASLPGTLTDAQGIARPFVARLQPTAPLVGLYDSNDSGCRAGAMVWYADGSADPRVQGTWCDRGGLVEQVEPVRPLQVDAAGLRVRLGPRGGLRQIRLRALVR